MLMFLGLCANTSHAMTVHNDTRRPVAIAFVRTIFKIGDRHNKIYSAPNEQRQNVIDRTDVYVIPPGKNVTIPSLGQRDFLTYDRDLWASYSYDSLVRSIIEPTGRAPHKKTVFYYNIGSKTNAIHIVEHRKSQLAFIIESPSNLAKLKELGTLVSKMYVDARPQRYSLGSMQSAPKTFTTSSLSPTENDELIKQFNRLMRLLAIPYRM